MSIQAAISNKIKKNLLYQLFIQKIVENNHKKAIKKIREKKIINVAFFLINLSQWKYEKLYFLLKDDDRFNPIVFVCPFITYSKEIMKSELRNAFQYLSEREYNVINIIDEDGSLIDAKKVFKPDLVFFSSSWSHTYKPYLVHNFLDTLTAYVPYAYTSSGIFDINFNKPIHNLSWKFFVESTLHKKWAQEHSYSHGKNVVVTGYPGLDILLDSTYKPKNPWKPQKNKKKRIIWAPHHTIPGHQNIEFSNFLEYSELMLDIAGKYKDFIQFAFKPHPNLKGKLYEDKEWGENRTNLYYKRWEELPNGQLEEGSYVDLFLTSDAMIHDSRSFIAEYLATQKPVMFLMRNSKIKMATNCIGLKAFEKMYIGKQDSDIIHFIEEVVLLGNDIMKNERKEFFKNYLNPPNNKLASENIYDHIVDQLIKH